MRVAAAYFHEPVVPLRVGQAADPVGGSGDQLRFTKFVNKSHGVSSAHGPPALVDSSESPRPYPRTSSIAASLSPSSVSMRSCCTASSSLILLIAKPTWMRTQSPLLG